MDQLFPCLWFKDEAEQAVEFYLSVFKDGRIRQVMRMGPEGPVIVIEFELRGRRMMALNGNRNPGFTPAVSLVVECETQDDIDALWDVLSAAGKTQQCGWLSDRYGVTWQIVPRQLPVMLRDSDAARVMRVIQAMTPMVKLDLAVLTAAYLGA